MRNHDSRFAVLAPALGLAVVLAGCTADDGPGGPTDTGAPSDGPADAAGDAADTGGDPGDAAGDEAGDGTGDAWVAITYPTEGGEAPNPVTFTWDHGEGVVTVELECEGWPLQSAPIPADQGSHIYDFSGVNVARYVVLTGFDAGGIAVATDGVNFTPTEEGCTIPDQDGFNHYTVAAINDATRFPKDGTYPYCWEAVGDTCGGMWGQVFDGSYAGEVLFPGGGDCFCSGHTLEIFLRSFALWAAESGLPDTTLFTVGTSVLTLDDVDIGDFYQWWQGFGVADYSSSAQAFETTGIGQNVWEADWDSALPGDYANLSRSTGSGHSVIFVSWVVESGVKVGIRYYGCNGSGESCPDPEDPENVDGVSGPSFNTEYFDGYGGTVMPEYLFIGRAFMPEAG